MKRAENLFAQNQRCADGAVSLYNNVHRHMAAPAISTLPQLYREVLTWPAYGADVFRFPSLWTPQECS